MPVFPINNSFMLMPKVRHHLSEVWLIIGIMGCMSQQGDIKGPLKCIWDIYLNISKYTQEVSNSLELGGCGEDVAYPKALIECLFRSPSQLDVRTGGSQQKLTAHFAFSVCVYLFCEYTQEV